MVLEEVKVMGGCKGKELVDRGCGSEVMWFRVGGGEEKFRGCEGVGIWRGFPVHLLNLLQTATCYRLWGNLPI